MYMCALCTCTATPSSASDLQQRKRLQRHELEVRQSTAKMRDLSINIRMKEQLIRELVKSSRDAHAVNQQYKEKLQVMEKVSTRRSCRSWSRSVPEEATGHGEGKYKELQVMERRSVLNTRRSCRSWRRSVQKRGRMLWRRSVH